MANEIVELRRTVIGKHTSSGADRLSFDALFIYDLSANPILINEPSPVQYVPSPRSGLPPEVETYGLVNAGELAAFDDGSMAFYIERGVEQLDGETFAALFQRVKRVYAKRARIWDELRTALANSGHRFNA